MSSPEAAGLAERLGGAHVDVRHDLEISRHQFRGEVAYVIRDPLTFQVHRLTRLNYLVLTRLSSERPLSETFTELVEGDHLESEDEESFYGLVMQLHRLDFLKLPISDDAALYERYKARVKAAKAKFLSSIFFAQIPLIDPDRFLRATMHLVRPLFSRAAAIMFAMLVGVASWMLTRNWAALQEPVTDVFSGDNLPLLWVTLIGLKVVHEFGHAYSCRLYGGHVPEMGAYLIVGTPCAYMDATASWSFAKKSQRILVCFAGMYVEVTLAAIAAILWCVTPPGTFRSLCHNVVLLASFVTVGMNLNPLMRYDGYYALCDALEVPNLRARAQAAASGLLAHYLVGVPAPEDRTPRGLRAFLIAFGIAGAIYKVTVVLGISMMIAMKFPLVGLFLAGLYVGQTLFGIARKAIPYLLKSDETAAHRPRAVAVLLLFGVLLPASVFGVPIPASVSAPAVAGSEQEWVLRAENPAFLSSALREPGTRVTAGDALLQLDDPALERSLRESAARVTAAEVAHHLAVGEGPLAAREAQHRLAVAREEHAHKSLRLAALDVRAGADGVLVNTVTRREQGRWVEQGEELARIVSGRTVVTALFDAEDLAGTRPEVGQRALFQPRGRSSERHAGTILRVQPAGSRELDQRVARHLDATELALDPSTGRAGSPRFEVELALDEDHVPYGSSGRLRIESDATPLGVLALRRLLLFVARL